MTYTPNYIRRVCKPFSPKKAVRSFRDLEVYQKTMELSVVVAQQVLPTLVKQTYPLVEGMRDCVLSVPLLIAEAHGMRFSNFDKAVATLEHAMQGCNKTIVYLEQAAKLFPKHIDAALCEDLAKNYIIVRGKMLRLERSWQKFRAAPH